MSLEVVNGSPLAYHLVSYDAAGQEREGGSAVKEELTEGDITDVLVMCHGWLGDLPGAKRQYGAWVSALGACAADLELLSGSPHCFRPLLVGLHWPSLPWGDEELGEMSSGAAAEWVDAYAGRLADTPTARDALGRIFDYLESGPPIPGATPPASLLGDYYILEQESGLTASGVCGPPCSDREPLNVSAVCRKARRLRAGEHGGWFRDNLLAPLRALSFWKMKGRAQGLGEGSAHELVRELQKLTPEVGFHVLGHSFGCVLACALVQGPRAEGLSRPADSLFLAQGALSLWSFCTQIPYSPCSPGYFSPVLGAGLVTGPVVTTRSAYDTAVGKWYPLAAWAGRDVTQLQAGDSFPKYGGVGTYGLHGPGPVTAELEMLPAYSAYQFQPNRVYNLDAGKYINQGGGLAGAHSDIAKPEVAHAFWQTVAGARAWH